MEDIVRRIFQPYNKRYRKYGSSYINLKEFEDLLQKMNTYPIKKGSDLYPLQIRKEYYISGF